jgi:rubrerythrin
MPDALAPRTQLPQFKTWIHDCDICGTRMFEKHCKIRCPNCGYTRDCSDP